MLSLTTPVPPAPNVPPTATPAILVVTPGILPKGPVPTPQPAFQAAPFVTVPTVVQQVSQPQPPPQVPVKAPLQPTPPPADPTMVLLLTRLVDKVDALNTSHQTVLSTNDMMTKQLADQTTRLEQQDAEIRKLIASRGLAYQGRVLV
jgi:hypothetical protein